MGSFRIIPTIKNSIDDWAICKIPNFNCQSIDQQSIFDFLVENVAAAADLAATNRRQQRRDGQKEVVEESLG